MPVLLDEQPVTAVVPVGKRIGQEMERRPRRQPADIPERQQLTHIAKRMIEAQNGKIRVTSRLGHGSTFTVTLRVANRELQAV